MTDLDRRGEVSKLVNGNSFRTLEFEAIRRLLMDHTGSSRGKSLMTALAPSSDVAQVREALGVTGEGVRLLRDLGRQPYHDLPDIDESLAGARVQGFALDPAALAGVASFIEGGGEIARRVARAEGAPRLALLASSVHDTSAVAAAIRRAILPDGEVADDASPKLAETRRAIARLRARLHSVMESFLRGKDADRVLQERLITSRNERYVLLVRAEQRGQLPGIIHGTSGSGASLFVEPMPAVDLNNDIVAFVEEERREVLRILQELTSRVGEVADALGHAVGVLGALDVVQAKAILARELDAWAPEMVEDLRLDLRRARHPLLLPSSCERLGQPRRSQREAVPVDLRVGFGAAVLVISGPNTGGKTVALKTVGLLALMAQSGLHIPAAPGSILPVFRRVWADIGDEQSIAADLSTFSAHLAGIVEMTRDLGHPSLVLLDEVGAGTDPTEGGALGVAIVDHFRSRGAMVVATTHHGLLKAYAQSTPGVTCASFGYHPDTFEPTFKLSLGTAGRSLALEMAERLGLPAQVVADARSRLDEKQAQAEALLKELEEQREGLTREREAIAAERAGLEEGRRALGRSQQRAEAERRAQGEAFAAVLKRKTEDAARRADEAIRRAVERVETARRSTATADRARTEALQTIQRAAREALADPELGLPAERDVPPEKVVPGARVRVRDLGVVGEVLSLHGELVEVAVGGKRLRVPRSGLAAAGRVRCDGRSPGFSLRHEAQEVPGEVNLVGLTVDEALPRVDKLLDNAALSDRREIRLIHGFGQGRLRKAVAGLLEGHPHVASFRSGGTGEGGGGVTVVELKE